MVSLIKHENCLDLTSRAASRRPRRRREYAAIKFFGGLDRFLFFKRFAQALDQSSAPLTDCEMFVEDGFVFALDQTVEIIGDQRVERPATEHLAGGRGADDAPFDFRPHGDFAHLRFFPFAATVDRGAHVVEEQMARTAGQQMLAEAAAIGWRHSAIKVITDQFFKPRAIHLLNLRGRQDKAWGVGEVIVVRRGLEFKPGPYSTFHMEYSIWNVEYGI